MSLKFRYKTQEYQTQAVNSVINFFNSQPYIENQASVLDRKGLLEINSFYNHKIVISENNLLNNLNNIQINNGIKSNSSLDKSNETNCLNLTIEMETGTGKTYVYLKTIFELNKKYGWSKFIIMVPSIAIREGVLSSIDDTKEHFKQTYEKDLNYFVYDSQNSKNIPNIRNFIDPSLQVIIMNYQVFNSSSSNDSKKIDHKTEGLDYFKPIDFISSVNPILIFDEPQKFGKSTIKAINKFNPLFILRYSATHKETLNLVYKLGPVDAFKQNLVKKIGVYGNKIVNSEGIDTYLYLDEVIISKNEPQAKIELEIKYRDTIKKEIRNVKKGTDLFQLSNGLEKYEGYKVSEIDGTDENHDLIKFSNGKELRSGEVMGQVGEEDLRRIQIIKTITAHLNKERQLYRHKIKCLSLFFIDSVEKYRKYNESNEAEKGIYAQIFEEEYQRIKTQFIENLANSTYDYDLEYLKYLKNIDVYDTHTGYFSIDKTSKKLINPDESGGVSKNASDFDLIMKEKKKLLKLDEERQVRFIFSHSALQEGWDNPNVFQICTLKKANAEDKKRQEIGRGLRICVNTDLVRMDTQTTDYFKDLNKLSVIASESYEDFSRKLQGEYKPENANDGELEEGIELINENKVSKFKAGLNSNSQDKKFIEFWNIISQKSVFQTDFDTEELINKSVKYIDNELNIPKIRVEETVGQINNLEDAEMDGIVENITIIKGTTSLDKRRDLIGNIVKETGLKRETIYYILIKISPNKFEMYKNNPDLFILRVSKLINNAKVEVILDKSRYEITDNKIDIDILKDYYSELQGQFDKNIFYLGPDTKHISDHIKIDNVETEIDFFEKAEKGLVDIYAKLPPEFKISTPVGYHNPDWAVILKKDNFKKIYFVVETKGYRNRLDMRQKESLKTKYAEKHFDAIKIGNVGYKIVDSFETFMDEALTEN